VTNWVNRSSLLHSTETASTYPFNLHVSYIIDIIIGFSIYKNEEKEGRNIPTDLPSVGYIAYTAFCMQ
jgi:hypothetical protein